MPKKQNSNRKNKQSNFAKLSIFQPNKYKFKKSCPLSVKGAPKVDYKNIKLLKKYVLRMVKYSPRELQMFHKKTTRVIYIYKKSKKSSINLMKVILLENLKKSDLSVK